MSLSVLTRGGSSGPTASIFVTGLSESDTVTATKDGVTKEGKWTTGITSYLAPMIPNMTSNTTPKGVASASKYYSDRAPYRAFDGNESTVWEISYTQTANTGDYLRYDFAEPFVPVSFDLSAKKGVNGTFSVNIVVVYEDDTEETIGSGTFDNNLSGITKDISVTKKIKAVKIVPTSFTSYNQIAINEFQIYGFAKHVIYGHEITGIKGLGTWVVTATNGEDTTTKDVLVDVITEYEIEMSLSA